MTPIEQTINALGQMSVTQLKDKYLEVCGEPARTGNRTFLFKRVAWRVQSLAEGGLSERAKRRAEELARDADLRTSMPRPPKAEGGGGPPTHRPPPPSNTAPPRPSPRPSPAPTGTATCSSASRRSIGRRRFNEQPQERQTCAGDGTED